MLTQLYIKNFVIVETLTLELQSGFCVLTGETGAGKSIWVDALLLAMGARAESGVVRAGAAQCDISLTFDISRLPSAQAWLSEHDFIDEAEDHCLIRRIIKQDGKSKSTINGYPCSLNLIKTLAPLLVVTHSQHQHQALLKTAQQRQQLDHYADTSELVSQLNALYHQWKQSQHEHSLLQAKTQDREKELELLQFHLTELAQLNFSETEWPQLLDEHRRAHQAKSFIQRLHDTVALTSEQEPHNAIDLIQQALISLEPLISEDEQAKGIHELLTTALVHAEEANTQLHDLRESLDVSPERLDYLEARIQLIHDVARKHHATPEQLPDMTQSLQHQFDELTHIEANLNSLAAAIANQEQQYRTLGKRISKQRQRGAQQLSDAVNAQLPALSMAEACFQVSLTPNATPEPTAHGLETVNFELSANAGQPHQALAKAASGGELSRISLALQVCLTEKVMPPLLIFDEVDAGIGGETAHAVGQLLRTLGSHSQLLCITHLAQVAAQAHHHYHVHKTTSNNHTFTHIEPIDNEDRTNEIARMLGGTNDTSQALAATLLQC